jgi:hypothetical protein
MTVQNPQIIIDEANAVLKATNLLTPEQVSNYLQITLRQLQNYRRHAPGQVPRLAAVRLGQRTVRYRLTDVVRFVEEGYNG